MVKDDPDRYMQEPNPEERKLGLRLLKERVARLDKMLNLVTKDGTARYIPDPVLIMGILLVFRAGLKLNPKILGEQFTQFLFKAERHSSDRCEFCGDYFQVETVCESCVTATKDMFDKFEEQDDQAKD
jgi:hypothetical protein